MYKITVNKCYFSGRIVNFSVKILLIPDVEMR